MRTKKALLTSFSSILLQLVTVVSGFVLPRMIISAFGSEVNGAVSSITQFLGYISLFEAGVGGVTRAALYKPIANKNYTEISGIANATQSFFRKLAYFFIVYVLILSILFKYISSTALSICFTATLVIIIAISTFIQYYFGMTYSIILQSDQCGYISNFIQIITVIVATIFSILLIKLGCGIHLVKLTCTGIYVFRPLCLRLIVKKKYNLDKKVPLNNDALKQRWNGLGQHIAYFIHNNVDIMVLTIFLGLKYVSVYNVYYMIVNGIRTLVVSLSGGSEAAFGDMIAKNEKTVLDTRFRMIETLSSCVIVVFFTTTAIMLLDFIKLYTKGITDTNYIIPVFGILLVISEALHSVKQYYQVLVVAAGRYKETQIGAFVEAGLNILLSVVFVNFWGISGVVIATIIATFFRLIDYVIYLRKDIINRKISVFVKRFIVTFISAISVILACVFIPFFPINNYLAWVMKAFMVFIISTIITFLYNFIFYKNEIKRIFSNIKSIFCKKKSKN